MDTLVKVLLNWPLLCGPQSVPKLVSQLLWVSQSLGKLLSLVSHSASYSISHYVSQSGTQLHIQSASCSISHSVSWSGTLLNQLHSQSASCSISHSVSWSSTQLHSQSVAPLVSIWYCKLLIQSVIQSVKPNSSVYLVYLRAGLRHKTHSTYISEDNRGSWLMKVLVRSFCGIWSGNRNLKYSMKLITYIQNRPVPFKVKPCFTDTQLVQKAYYYNQFALSLGKENFNLSLINSTCSIQTTC